jgi:Mce-associated membrane protein
VLRGLLPRGPEVGQSHLLAPQEVVGAVSGGLKSVFSYDHANLERAEQAAEVALTGPAAEEFDRELAAVSERAREQERVRVSTVRSIGVRELRGDEATLLVFLDQQTASASGEPESSTATLLVTAVRVDDGWRIFDIESL